MSGKISEIIGMPGAMLTNFSGKGITDPPEYGDSGEPIDMLELQKQTLPIAQITPCRQRWKAGLEMYVLEPAMDQAVGQTESFRNQLSGYGYEYEGTKSYLEFVYQGGQPLIENYTNTFDHSFAANAMNTLTSSPIAEFAQMADMNRWTQVTAAAKAHNVPGAETMGNIQSWLGAQSKNFFGKDTGAAVNKIADTINKKIDFPMIWKSSGYTASYELTIKLYNPCPLKDSWHERYILGPLVALLLFVLPYSAEGNFYQWPFLCRFTIPGLVRLNAAYVSNVSVIKGGGDGLPDISRVWRPSQVDVRLSISSLYNVMLNAKDDPSSDQPILKRDIEEMRSLKGRNTTEGYTNTASTDQPDQGLNRAGDTDTQTAYNNLANTA